MYAAILVYRMAAGCSTTCRGTYVKLTHTILHLATVPCVVFGGVASMEYHRLKGMPHLYSVHSWMGLMTVSLFVIQVTATRIDNNLIYSFVFYSGVSYRHFPTSHFPNRHHHFINNSTRSRIFYNTYLPLYTRVYINNLYSRGRH